MLLVVAIGAAACGGKGGKVAHGGTSPAPTKVQTPTSTTAPPTTTAPAPMTAPPPTAGPTVPGTAAPFPGPKPATTPTIGPPATTGPFTGTVATVSAADIPFSWRKGCPLDPGQLRMLQLSYWGFDNQPHLGSMVVNAAVTGDVLKIFGRLFADHFPIHQMQPIDVYHGSDPASMAADNTSGFNCRYAVAAGTPQWSVHAFGEAIDVNAIENPYIFGGTVMPEAGRAFVDRANVRPGMAVAGGELVQAFASAGWQWGGRWAAAPDYQHFSKTGG